jgi:hypothetical protein
MKYRIKNLEEFTNSVFGSDYLLELFPELTTTGVNLIKINNFFYVADDNNSALHDCAFFNKEELNYLKQIY